MMLKHTFTFLRLIYHIHDENEETYNKFIDYLKLKPGYVLKCLSVESLKSVMTSPAS